MPTVISIPYFYAYLNLFSKSLRNNLLTISEANGIITSARWICAFPVYGELSEWLKVRLSKSRVPPKGYRGFKSHALRFIEKGAVHLTGLHLL